MSAMVGHGSSIRRAGMAVLLVVLLAVTLTDNGAPRDVRSASLTRWSVEFSFPNASATPASDVLELPVQGVALGVHLINNSIVMLWQHWLVVVDKASGARRWSAEFGDREIVAWTLSDPYLVLTVADGTAMRTTAVDTRNGHEIWGVNDLFLSGQGFNGVAGHPAEAVVVALDVWARSWQGLDVETGNLAWSAALPPGCWAWRTDTGDFGLRRWIGRDEHLIVNSLECESGGWLQALDPSSGKVRWQRTFAAEMSPVIPDVQDELTLVSSGGAAEIIDPTGRVLFQQAMNPPQRWARTTFVVSGSHALVQRSWREGDRQRSQVSSIDTSTGAIARQQEDPVEGTFLAGDDRVYRVSQGFPAALSELDILTGLTRSVSFLPTYRERILAIEDGLIYLAVEQSKLMVMDRDSWSPHLQPAPADRWPDPCALVTEADLEPLRPATRVWARVHSDVVGRHDSPRSSCTYRISSKSSFAISINWIDVTEQAARNLMQVVRNGADDPEDVPGVGDEAVKLGGELIVRVGFRLFTASSSDIALSVADLAILIARKLTL